jgi:ubiquinone/menaquinone biosynthesis C-methylase UbiE
LASVDLVTYYRKRAGTYEAIYDKPERQRDLSLLKEAIPAKLRGRRVLEIACGTGYWTTLIAAQAASITAVDLADEPMKIAMGKKYEKPPTFKACDAYALPDSLGRFDGAFAGFWWSHIPRKRIPQFLASLHARLEPGARVVMFDNRYVEGSSTPIAETDADGDTWQVRGSDRVLKNFPAATELRGVLPGVTVQELEYYWLAEYELK